MSVPRWVRSELAQGWTKSRIRSERHPQPEDRSRTMGFLFVWCPRRLLTSPESHFDPSRRLTVKTSRRRVFMYEEPSPSNQRNDDNNDDDDDENSTRLLSLSPSELADHLTAPPPPYCYWTSPLLDVAPGLLPAVQGYEQLYHDREGDGDCNRNRNFNRRRRLDPRGPSLWMGSPGSCTQCHYDVADNVLVQLYGAKRVRCYPPTAAASLHVFPDAHPRARKSQVNFDEETDRLTSILTPTLDVILHPGDCLEIPAFWFHHVEVVSSHHCHDHDHDHHHHASSLSPALPSVSLNLFALSDEMQIAQGIFQDGSTRFLSVTANDVNPIVILEALSVQLFRGLRHHNDNNNNNNNHDHYHDPWEFIQRELLDARYAPLRLWNDIDIDYDWCNGSGKTKRNVLTDTETHLVSDAIARLLPQWKCLEQTQNHVGVTSLVLCHLLELWAVELVGASRVAQAWKEVIRRQQPSW